MPAIPLPHFSGTEFFKDEQIVMPKAIDIMLNIFTAIPNNDKPSLTAEIECLKDNKTTRKSRRDRTLPPISVKSAST